MKAKKEKLLGEHRAKLLEVRQPGKWRVDEQEKFSRLFESSWSGEEFMHRFVAEYPSCDTSIARAVLPLAILASDCLYPKLLQIKRHMKAAREAEDSRWQDLHKIFWRVAFELIGDLSLSDDVLREVQLYYFEKLLSKIRSGREYFILEHSNALETEPVRAEIDISDQKIEIILSMIEDLRIQIKQKEILNKPHLKVLDEIFSRDDEIAASIEVYLIKQMAQPCLKSDRDIFSSCFAGLDFCNTYVELVRTKFWDSASARYKFINVKLSNDERHSVCDSLLVFLDELTTMDVRAVSLLAASKEYLAVFPTDTETKMFDGYQVECTYYLLCKQLFQVYQSFLRLRENLLTAIELCTLGIKFHLPLYNVYAQLQSLLQGLPAKEMAQLESLLL